MDIFNIQSRDKTGYGTFFPDPVLKEKDVWRQTLSGSHGWWTAHRLVTGNYAELRLRITKVARNYSAQRQKFEHIDQFELFQNIGQVRPTRLTYYDYAGRIDTVARNAVSVALRSGERRDLDRNQGVGFRGVIVEDDAPWSMESWMLDEVLRTRLFYLLTGDATAFGGNLSVSEPWRLRDAAERQLRSIWEIAYTEWTLEGTPEKTQALIDIQRNVMQYVLETMHSANMSNLWEHMVNLPFPDRAAAIRLWEQDRLAGEADHANPFRDSLVWDQTNPWYVSMPAGIEREVTACRSAYLSDNKVFITLRNSPVLAVTEHPTLPVSHQLYTYGPHSWRLKKKGDPTGTKNSGIRKTTINTDPDTFRKHPFLGGSGTYEDAWDGTLPPHPGWNVLMGDGAIPDPKLKVRYRTTPIPPQMAERITAVFQTGRPTLIEEDINEGVAPILVLPRMFLQAQIVPLFSGGTSLRPINEGAEVSGWAVKDTEKAITSGLFDTSGLNDFISTPISARPIREGALSEVFPS